MNLRILIITLFALIILIIAVYFFISSKDGKEEIIHMDKENKNLIIRQPAVAGQFYPSDKDELSEMIDGFLKKAAVVPLQPGSKQELGANVVGKGERPVIIIAPHAGYVFCGQTAAYGFKALLGHQYDKVILIGNSHQEYFEGLVFDNSDFWQTPLGQVALDKEIIKDLASQNNQIKIDQHIHLTEHSLEVELPFLQKILGSDFKLMPALTGSDKNLTHLKSISESLKNVRDERTLIVISTDLSHYPKYEDAQIVDQKTIEAILKQDSVNFLSTIDKLEKQGIENLATAACGWPAVVVALELARELKLTPELLNYTNSGETPYGDKERVVGYAAVVFLTSPNPLLRKEGGLNPPLTKGRIKEGFEKNNLNSSEQQVALKLARNTLERAFDKNTPEFNDYQKYEIFQEKRGLFVTLHKNNELRGCIGFIEPPEIPLSEAIQEMALSAAFHDSRFPPLKPEELRQIKIEISVLTVPEKIESAAEIELGKHGVIVKKGGSQGVFLPQVAIETKWSKEKFLSELCTQKANLDENCWQDPSVEIYTFEAQVFSE